jgi:hypothetical protein
MLSDEIFLCELFLGRFVHEKTRLMKKKDANKK